jgi:hypothetical protein
MNCVKGLFPLEVLRCRLGMTSELPARFSVFKGKGTLLPLAPSSPVILLRAKLFLFPVGFGVGAKLERGFCVYS